MPLKVVLKILKKSVQEELYKKLILEFLNPEFG